MSSFSANSTTWFWFIYLKVLFAVSGSSAYDPYECASDTRGSEYTSHASTPSINTEVACRYLLYIPSETPCF